MDYNKIIKDKTLEQLDYIKMFLTETNSKTDKLNSEVNIVKVIKSKAKEINFNDVKDNLVDILMTEAEIVLLSKQAVEYHIPLFREYTTLSEILGIDLSLTDEDVKLISELSPSNFLLFSPTSSGINITDEKIYNALMSKHKEKVLSEDTLKMCFDKIKV